jgi:DNA-directed RNA polymerase specialized sigma24 family protein
MATGLSQQTFARLLEHLDADRDRAGERYEDLRRTLVRFFEWRGAPFPDEHTDETLDRVARKLAEGVDIRNVGAYCYTVARLILLETRKTPDARRAPLETTASEAAPDRSREAAEKETRLGCLDECLHALPAESRTVIVEYYREDKRARIDARRLLAERVGVRPEALANRAQRLRDKLERCVKLCLSRKSAT